MYPSMSFRKKVWFACSLLAGLGLLKLTGHGAAALPLGLIAGTTWVAGEPIIQLLAAVGLVDATTGKLTPIASVIAKTADYVLTGAEPSGTMFTTRGAAGAVNFTLPLVSAKLAGTTWRFKNAVDQNMTVTSNPADTLICDGDLTADSLAASTASHKINAEIEVFCDGTAFYATGKGIGATYTVAT